MDCNFIAKDFWGRYDVCYKDEDQEVFIISCNNESNAKLVAKILNFDRNGVIIDSFRRKREDSTEDGYMTGHREIKIWDKEVAEQ